MDIEQMLQAIVEDNRDESIPDYDRLRQYYVVSTGGGGCRPCTLRRVKRAIRTEIESLLKSKT